MTAVDEYSFDHLEDLEVLDQDWLEQSYSSLEAFVLELDANPLDYGPSRLVEKIHRLRYMQNEVEKMITKAAHALSRVEQHILSLEAIYDTEKDYLLATDPHIGSGRSAADRQARVNVKLRKLVGKIRDAQAQKMALTTIHGLLLSKRSSLNATNSQINAQIKLINQEISLGAKWEPEVRQKKSSSLDLLEEEDNDPMTFGRLDEFFSKKTVEDMDFDARVDEVLSEALQA